ncbi:hypothetical protein PQX77_019101 [Marasmius sp. AFHP31]|nr:hypothetical protein PQX77_019101 [Marasmius sp. AFHP31]
MPRPKLYHSKAERREANRVKNKQFYNKNKKDILYSKQVKRDELNRAIQCQEIDIRKKRRRARETQAKRKPTVEIHKAQLDKKAASAEPTGQELCLRELEDRLKTMKLAHNQVVTPNAGKYTEKLCEETIIWIQATRLPLMQQPTSKNPLLAAITLLELNLMKYQSIEDEYFYATREQVGKYWDERRDSFTMYKMIVMELTDVLKKLQLTLDERILVCLPQHAPTKRLAHTCIFNFDRKFISPSDHDLDSVFGDFFLRICLYDCVEIDRRDSGNSISMEFFSILTSIYSKLFKNTLKNRQAKNHRHRSLVQTRNSQRGSCQKIIEEENHEKHSHDRYLMDAQFYERHLRTLKTSVQRELNNPQQYLENLYQELILWKRAERPIVSPLAHPIAVLRSLEDTTKKVGHKIRFVVGNDTLLGQFDALHAFVLHVYRCVNDLQIAVYEDNLADPENEDIIPKYITLEEWHHSKSLQMFDGSLVSKYEMAGL